MSETLIVETEDLTIVQSPCEYHREMTVLKISIPNINTVDQYMEVNKRVILG